MKKPDIGLLYATFQVSDTYTFINPLRIKSLLVCAGSGAVSPFAFSIVINGSTNYAANDSGICSGSPASPPRPFIGINNIGASMSPLYYPCDIKDVSSFILECNDPISLVIEYQLEKNYQQ